MRAETDYRCLVKGCKGVLIENHPSASTHWLECDICGETYTFREYHEMLEEKIELQ